MSDAYRAAYIYVRDDFAGILQEIEDGFSFKYDEEYLNSEDSAPVSLTMPMRAKEYTSKTLFAFFDGLIPEGWLLDIAVDNWKIDRTDRFRILQVACRDPIGNVSVRGEKL